MPVRIPFGKYKGEHIEDVAEDDPSYLTWLLGQTWANDELLEAAQFALEAPSGSVTSRGRVVKKARCERGFPDA